MTESQQGDSPESQQADSSVGQVSPDGLLKWDGTAWQPRPVEDWITDPAGAAHEQALRTGDMIMITMMPPTLVPDLAAPIALVASGFRHDNPGGQPLCVLGDELPPQLRGPIAYMEPPFMIPGVGQLQIPVVPPDSATPLHQIDGKPVLIGGGSFQVMFQVMVPATASSENGEPIPDPMPVKFGTAQFLVQNYDAYS